MRKRFAIALALIVAVVLTGVYIMPHGYPPWSGVKKQTVFSIPIDLAELAVRLGSIVTHDRRGDVVFMEGFDEGYQKWLVSYGGGGAAVQVSTDTARSGAYSVKLTTGKAAGGHGSLDKYHPRPVLSKVGLEAHFAPTTADPAVHETIYHYTGAGYYVFEVRYDHSTEKLQYLTGPATWEDIAKDLAFFPNKSSFNMMKLVVDLEANEFERVIFNDNGYTLPGVGGLWVGGASAPYLAIGVCAKGDASGNYTVYLDDVILTQNEP